MIKTFPFVLSDQSVNSMGFVVLTAGIDLDSFKKNPVMLFNHCEDDICGRWLNVRVEGDKLLAEGEFDEADPEAKDLMGKVERGFLKGCSIGFNISDMSLSVKGFEDIPVATKTVLHEASITPLPSNTNACCIYDAEGKLMNIDQVHAFINLKRNQNSTINKPRQKLALLIATLSLTADSTEDQVITAVNKLSKKANDDAAELVTLKKEKDDLIIERDGLKTQLTTQKDSQVENLVDGAIALSKISKAERETWITLAKADFDSTKKALDSRAAHVAVTSNLNNTNTPVAGDEKFLGMSFIETKKTPEGVSFLERLSRDNKSLFEKKRTNPSQPVTA